jgi:ABC-type transporter Mla MlaB component
MMRISVVQSSSQIITLRLEGEIKGPWVEELRRICEEFLSQSTLLILDLAGISLIDADAIALFQVLIGRHVVLTNPSLFIAEQLRGSHNTSTRN